MCSLFVSITSGALAEGLLTMIGFALRVHALVKNDSNNAKDERNRGQDRESNHDVFRLHSNHSNVCEFLLKSLLVG